MMNNDEPSQAPINGSGLDYDDDANSTIYHVPSFLLKTYEIVDVSILSHIYPIVTIVVLTHQNFQRLYILLYITYKF